MPTGHSLKVVSPDWATLQPAFDRLAITPLSSAMLGPWLEEWSTLEKAISEAIALAAISASRDTADADAQALHLRLAGEDTHRLDAQHLRLALRLVDLPDLPVDLLPVARAANDRAATFRADHLPGQKRQAELVGRYDELVGAMTVEWEGARVPLTALAAHGRSPDRATRERVMRTFLEAFIERRGDFSALFDDLCAVRQRMARSAGFDSFVDFTYRAQSRPYSPGDARALHDAIERHVVPAMTRRYDRRRRLLGLDTIRPWDVEAEPVGREPIQMPTSPAELLAATERVMAQIARDFGSLLGVMREEGLIDIEQRVNKAPGGFCTTLDVRERPFIFGNWLGTPDDVRLMLHEGGHAMHAFAIYAEQPLIFQRFPGAEVNELVALSMELLATPFLSVEAGGFYDEGDVGRARAEQLEAILSLLTYIARVDAFQLWLYESGKGGDVAARDAAWAALSRRFEPAVSWDDLPDGLAARWHQQSLIFTAPLYMVEYAFAQIGALQVWQRSRDDFAGAVANLREAMRLGNTRSADELYAAAGASLKPTETAVEAIVALIEAELQRLDQD